MEIITLGTILSILVAALFTIFYIFPLIGKAMRFIVDNNTETNEYRANLMNGVCILLFIGLILLVLYCIGFAINMLIIV